MSTDHSTVAVQTDVKGIITSRRTIHNFKPTPPSRELLLEAIDIARWAPNHKLTEPWKFYILGPETATRVAHLNADLVLRKRGREAAENKRTRWLNMPSMLAVSYKKCDDAFREKEDYAATCCAIQNLMLFLWEKGIGTKWSTSSVISEPDFLDLLGIEQGTEEVVGLLWCGYPEDIPEKSRRPVGDITTELP